MAFDRIYTGSSEHILFTFVEKNIDEFRFGLRYDSTSDTAVLLNTLFCNVLADNSLLNLDIKLGR